MPKLQARYLTADRDSPISFRGAVNRALYEHFCSIDLVPHTYSPSEKGKEGSISFCVGRDEIDGLVKKLKPEFARLGFELEFPEGWREGK